MISLNELVSTAICKCKPILLSNKTTDNPFEILEKIEIVPETKFRGPMSALYILLLNFATVGIAISTVLCGLKMVSTKNPSERAACKSEFFWKLILGIVIFGFTFILDLFYFISKDIV